MSKKKAFHLYLSEEELELFKTAAEREGLSVSEFLRNAARKRVDASETVEENPVRTINPNKKYSFKLILKEVEKIIQLLEEINMSGKVILEDFYKDRKKLYLEAKRELMKNIRNA